MYGFDEDEYQETSNDIDEEDLAADEETVDPEAQAQADRRFSKSMLILFLAIVGVVIITALAPAFRSFLSSFVR